MYKNKIGKDSVEISSDVSNVIAIYESGEIYFTKSDSEKMKLIDCVEDDMKEADASMLEPIRPTMPVPPDYSYIWIGDDKEYKAAKDAYDKEYEEYEIAYEKYKEERDEYNTALYEYEDKKDRDILREALAEEEIEINDSSLYYYNGKKEKLITDSYGGEQCVSTDKAVLVYEIKETSEPSKTKISEISNIYSFKIAVEGASEDETKIAVSVEGKVTEMEESATNFAIDDEGTTIYYFQDYDSEERRGDLYKIKVSGKKLKKSEKYDTDVDARITCLSDDNVYYYKDVEDDIGELYMNSQKVDDDVYASLTRYNKEKKSLTYIVNYNEEEYGTLKEFKEKSVEISEDVYLYRYTPNGEILYLKNYDVDDAEGEMYLYKGGEKSEKVDDHVSDILYTFKYEASYEYMINY